MMCVAPDLFAQELETALLRIGGAWHLCCPRSAPARSMWIKNTSRLFTINIAQNLWSLESALLRISVAQQLRRLGIA